MMLRTQQKIGDFNIC